MRGECQHLHKCLHPATPESSKAYAHFKRSYLSTQSVSLAHQATRAPEATAGAAKILGSQVLGFFIPHPKLRAEGARNPKLPPTKQASSLGVPCRIIFSCCQQGSFPEFPPPRQVAHGSHSKQHPKSSTPWFSLGHA